MEPAVFGDGTGGTGRIWGVDGINLMETAGRMGVTQAWLTGDDPRRQATTGEESQ